MGQRSQIYVRLSEEQKDGSIEKSLTARYYQWNYGERMVSRARGLVEWLKDTDYLGYNKNKIARIADVNFDYKDVVISQDILEEAKEWDYEENESVNDFIFDEQDNNDGQLFIDVKIPYAEEKPKKILIGFRDMGKDTVMNALEYMEWDMGDDDKPWQDSFKKYYPASADEIIDMTLKNAAYIDENAKLMTQEQLMDFLNDDYEKICNIERHIVKDEREDR